MIGRIIESLQWVHQSRVINSVGLEKEMKSRASSEEQGRQAQDITLPTSPIQGPGAAHAGRLTKGNVGGRLREDASVGKHKGRK